MKRPATSIVAVAALAGAALIAVSAAKWARRHDAFCGPGFVRDHARCRVPEGAPCPAPLVRTSHGCDAPDPSAVEIPETTVTVGPSDWEAEGRVAARTIHVGRFRIDRFEVSTARACASRVFADAEACSPTKRADGARAMGGVALDQARAFCNERGGRIPTSDEWFVAAAGDRPRRYPWGDTGAVCRRAAWGLKSGPCGEDGREPDAIGAHSDGKTPGGVHDLAGNVAEWVETGACPAPAPSACTGVVRGGSWMTSLATELRTWASEPAPAGGAAPSIGFRCAYDVATTSVP